MAINQYGSSSDLNRGYTGGSLESGTRDANIVGSPESFVNDGPGPDLMLASSLEGDDVYNPAGEKKLGDIKGIMLDVKQGRIAYAVLSFGGFLGIGDKLFAVPWQALTLDVDNKQFLLNQDKESLKNAPGFDKDHWPSMADSTWANEINTFYRSEPYWH